MSDKPGRNDACACGSGKKFKKCCMETSRVTTTSSLIDLADFKWHQLRQLEGTVVDNHLIPYVTQTLPDTVLRQAIDDCLPDNLPDECNQEILFRQFLM